MEVYGTCLQGNPEEHTILEFARLIKSLVGKVLDRLRFVVILCVSANFPRHLSPVQSSLYFPAYLLMSVTHHCPVVCLVLPSLSYGRFMLLHQDRN